MQNIKQFHLLKHSKLQKTCYIVHMDHFYVIFKRKSPSILQLYGNVYSLNPFAFYRRKKVKQIVET